MADKNYDIAVIGGGIVGSITAGLFAKQGFNVVLIDQKPSSALQQKTTNPRVSALNLASQNILDYLDCWQTIIQLGCQPYKNIYVWDHSNTSKIEFHSNDYHVPQLGFIVENDIVINTLTEKLKQSFNVEILPNTSLHNINISEDFIQLQTTDEQIINCKFLIGADGAHSKIRQLLSIESDFSDYFQQAIVCQITTEENHQDTAWQCFLPSGPIALLPITANRYSIVWSSDNHLAKEIMAWNSNMFCQQLSNYISHKVGRVVDCSDRAAFSLTQHHAHQYIATRSVIIGDAAHTIHPLAGLGVNLGIVDAAALAETVANSKLKNKNCFNHVTLRKYERWRRSENIVQLTAINQVKRMFESRSPYFETVRNIGLNVINQSPSAKQLFAKSAMGITGDLPEICRNQY